MENLNLTNKDITTLKMLHSHLSELAGKVVTRYNVEDPADLEEKLGEPINTLYVEIVCLTLKIEDYLPIQSNILK